MLSSIQVPGGTKLECILPDAEIRKFKGPLPGQDCGPLPLTGNPINFATGHKLQQELDFQSAGPYSLTLSRVYNSFDGRWRHTYSAALTFTASKFYVSRADGFIAAFTLQNGAAVAEPTERGSLVKTADTWVYTAPTNERAVFDSNGRLLRQYNAAGLEHRVSYDGPTLTISDEFGHTLVVTQDAFKQPLSFASEGVQGTYTYNADNRLTRFTRNLNGATTQRDYHYEDARNSGLLTGITDERGVRYASWAYDELGRAISSEHADGAERKTIAYQADGARIVTNELGKSTIYRFVISGGLQRIRAIEGQPSASCPNSNSTFTYDTRGLLKTKTDNKGHLTTYVYNTRGLEESRTEASGTPQARTITTTWHPTLNLRATVSEPARITTYHYDAQGRATGQTVTER